MQRLFYRKTGADSADDAGGITFQSDIWSETVFGTFGFGGAWKGSMAGGQPRPGQRVSSGEGSHRRTGNKVRRGF